MKKTNKIITLSILIVTFLFIGLKTAEAQDKRFAAFAKVDPNATLKDGFNIGLGVEYQMTVMYFKAQLFAFPELRGKNYFDYTASVGFNHHTRFEEWRIYAGMKAGTIFRDGTPFPTYGFETGIEYYFGNGLYLGIELTRDRRTDGRVWDSDIVPYFRNSGFTKIGLTF